MNERGFDIAILEAQVRFDKLFGEFMREWKGDRLNYEGGGEWQEPTSSGGAIPSEVLPNSLE